MTSKFSNIVKVKKQKLSEVENQLLDVRNRKLSIEKEIVSLDDEVSKLDSPKDVTIAKLQLCNHTLSMMMIKKDKLKERLKVRINQIEGLELLYKEANIEYEKILHLHEDDVKKQLKIIEVQESKDMDEIANILFTNKRKKEGK